MNQNFLITNFKDLLLYLSEYCRIWKIVFLSLGLSALIVGSFLAKMVDWDIGISVIMAMMTYFFSSISGTIFLSFYFKSLKKKYILLYLILAIFLWIISVDISYILYSQYMHHVYYRGTNFLASTALYFICALMLSYRGSFKGYIEVIKNTKLI